LAWLKKNGYADFTVLPVDNAGKVDPDDLRAAIRPDTGLVSIMYANNEIGVMQPIEELSAIAKSAGAVFHTDATQAVGKIAVDVARLGVDALSLSGHKFHGPKGIGALYLKKGTRLSPFMHGGGQEGRRRAGTSNVAGAVGMGKAAEFASDYIADGPRQASLVENIWQGLSAEVKKIRRNGHPTDRLPNLLSLCVEGAEGEAILGYLDMHGLQASSGSACTSGSLDPSHVLLACGVPVDIAHGSLRISISHETSKEDAELLIRVFPEVVARLRAMSPTWKE
ncbi:MAG: aminotransferase class V-fold PLP-dependent enzyme, partial [Planctomycetes bacterium]|nr:aminotransferase class V-fold PLP-dependent enzyme [Planctomycetota bacterium]